MTFRQRVDVILIELRIVSYYEILETTRLRFVCEWCNKFRALKAELLHFSLTVIGTLSYSALQSVSGHVAWTELRLFPFAWTSISFFFLLNMKETSFLQKKIDDKLGSFVAQVTVPGIWTFFYRILNSLADITVGSWINSIGIAMVRPGELFRQAVVRYMS